MISTPAPPILTAVLINKAVDMDDFTGWVPMPKKMMQDAIAIVRAAFLELPAEDQEYVKANIGDEEWLDNQHPWFGVWVRNRLYENTEFSGRDWPLDDYWRQIIKSALSDSD